MIWSGSGLPVCPSPVGASCVPSGTGTLLVSARAAGGLEGHQPGGVEQEWVQVLGLDGPVKRWLRATSLDFWHQFLHLLNGYQDLEGHNHTMHVASYELETEGDFCSLRPGEPREEGGLVGGLGEGSGPAGTHNTNKEETNPD
ncbi:hypothetical protein CCH79_00009953 [Gambusia affinis]|uniref:Uncharacterized protein n=1 Tax=Gambusia affinis TaxID=33528 RepID=A0A315V5D1_GAMAF|nr:hypothetical protein CCH79_00009953 [Gambusia affinis]